MLEELLKTRPWLLADGATGTNLFNMGLTSGDAPELWTVEHPDRIQRLHQMFVDAGAHIILTNTFGCNRRRLMLHKAEGRVRELNRAAARLAREVAKRAGRPVVVGGSVGPTGDLLEPLGPLTDAEAEDVFFEQIEGLKEGGADVVWIETMSALEEMRAAAKAAARAGMPYTLTASFDTAGRTMMGVTPEAFAAFVAQLDPPAVACGANCGVGASDTVAAILAITAANPDLVVISKANAGIPQVHGSHVHYSGSPKLMAEYARLALDAGARIIGGCCGTSPEHLAAMRRSLEGYSRSARPALEDIAARTGAFVAPPAQASASPREGRRRK
jgi:methionine synthase I (cobalamin-dependent)